MSSGTLNIRDATGADMPAIAQIYAHHVLHGLATFELVPPDAEEIARRHAAITALGMPWIVAESDGSVRGYAYASRYRERPAYRHTLEDSIYLDAAFTHRGLGTALLEALVAASAKAGARQMIAVIGDSGNAASIRLHARCGFTHAGTLQAVGWKFGRWVDSVIMQRPLGAGDATSP